MVAGFALTGLEHTVGGHMMLVLNEASLGPHAHPGVVKRVGADHPLGEHDVVEQYAIGAVRVPDIIELGRPAHVLLARR